MTAPRLENRLPQEDLLERDEHPLRELAWLLSACVAMLAALVMVSGLLASWLAPKLPFEHEMALAERLFPAVAHADADAASRQAALQALADRVAASMSLPPGMKVFVSDEPSELVNAYATVGGRIRVFHGLLRLLKSEEALAALLAHEIAHVKHRHVAAGMGHGIALVLALSVVAPEGAAQTAHGLLGGAAQLALLGYSREHEHQADAGALAASLALYGHGRGLAELFAALPSAESAPGTAWLRSHADTAERLNRLEAAAAGRWGSLSTPSTPLPEALRKLPASPARSTTSATDRMPAQAR